MGTGAFGLLGLHAQPHVVEATSHGSVCATILHHPRGPRAVREMLERQNHATTQSALVSTHTWFQYRPGLQVNYIFSVSVFVVAGGWTAWSEWSQCSTSCGGGLISRRRECLNPAPQNGGKPCAGEATDYKACNKQPCPVGKSNLEQYIFMFCKDALENEMIHLKGLSLKQINK